MALINNKTYDSKYNPNQLTATLAIASGAVVFSFTFLGVVFLCCDSKVLTVIFIIGWIGLFLLAFIAGIICLVLAVNVNIINSFTCQSIAESRNAVVDTYMGYVDQNFCSLGCPCDISNSTWISFNSVPLSIRSTWITPGYSNQNYSFANCPEPIRNSTFYTSNATDYGLSFDSNHNNATLFDETTFFNTWNYLETTYSCSGFCNMTYINSIGVNMTIYKYLFSNVNNGVPPYRSGCYKAIINTTAGYLSSYGAYIMCLSIFMLVILVNLFSYLCSSDLTMEDNRNVVMLSKI